MMVHAQVVVAPLDAAVAVAAALIHRAIALRYLIERQAQQGRLRALRGKMPGRTLMRPPK